MKLHEAWRLEYELDAYLSHLSGEQLSERARYLIENMSTLESNGKIGLRDVRHDPGRTLMRKFTHILQEQKRRGIGFQSKFMKEASIPKAMLGHEAKLRELSEYAARKKPHIVKFGDIGHFINHSFKVSLASGFSDPSLNTARLDEELKSIFHPPPKDVKISSLKGEKLEGVEKIELTLEIARDYYVFCSSLNFDVSAPRKARRIWSGESPGMVRVNHPPLPSVAPLAERRLRKGTAVVCEQKR